MFRCRPFYWGFLVFWVILIIMMLVSVYFYLQTEPVLNDRCFSCKITDTYFKYREVVLEVYGNNNFMLVDNCEGYYKKALVKVSQKYPEGAITNFCNYEETFYEDVNYQGELKSFPVYTSVKFQSKYIYALFGVIFGPIIFAVSFPLFLTLASLSNKKPENSNTTVPEVRVNLETAT